SWSKCGLVGMNANLHGGRGGCCCFISDFGADSPGERPPRWRVLEFSAREVSWRARPDSRNDGQGHYCVAARRGNATESGELTTSVRSASFRGDRMDDYCEYARPPRGVPDQGTLGPWVR